MRKRVWFLLFFAVISGLGVTWVRWGLPRVERRLYVKIQSALVHRLHRPVHLDRVRLHPLFLAVTLENLRISAEEGPEAPVLFACRRWTVLLTPIHRAEKFPWITLSFGKSQVETPVLRLDALPPSSGKTPAFSLFSILPAHRLEWTHGSFHFPSSRFLPSFTLADASGSAILSGGDASVEVQGGTPWGPLNVAAHAGETLFFTRRQGVRWKALLVLPDANLEDLSVLSPVPPPGVWKGKAALTLTLEGGLQPPAISRWTFSADFKDDAWTEGQEPWTVSGRLTVSPEKWEADGLSLNHALTLSGSVSDPMSPGKTGLDLSLRADAFPLEKLQGRLPWRPLSALPWRGEADLRASLKGTRLHPDLRASLHARGAGAGPVVFPKVEADLTSDQDRFQLESSLADGRFQASAARPENGNWSAVEWQCHLEGLRLETLAQAGGWGNIRGSLGGDFALRRSSESFAPLAGGVLRLDNGAWGDHHLSDTLISYFSWRESTLRFHDKTDSFDVLAHLDDDGWTLSHLAYGRADGMSVQASGAVSGPEKNISFKATVHQASLRDVPFLLERYPDLEGRWEAEAAMEGTAAAPVLRASFQGGGARFAGNAPPHSFRGEIQWKEGNLSLNDFDVDGAWSASALRLSDGQWQAGLAARRADVALFREISGSSAPLSGLVDGRFSLNGGGGAFWEGAVQASSPQLRWGGLVLSSAAIQGAWEKDAIRLDKFSFETSSRPCAYQGGARRGADGSWAFSVEGPFLEKARGKALLAGSLLSLSGVSLGGGLEAEGAADFSAKTLRGRLSAKAASAAALGRRFGAAWPESAGGNVDADLLLRGSFSSPEVSVEARWSGARWRELPLKASLRGGWKDGVMNVDRGLLESEGGRVETRGTLPWDPAAPLSFTARAEGLPLAPFGLKAGGAWGGDVLLEGTRADPTADLSLKASGVKVGDWPAFGARLEAHYHGGVLSVKEGEAFTSEGRWRLRPGGSLRFMPQGFQFDIDNDLRNVALGPLSLFGGLRFSGEGRLGPPESLSLVLTAQQLWVNQQLFDQELARVTWSEGRLVFDPPPDAGRKKGGPARQRFSGAVDLSAWPKVLFQKVSLWEGEDQRLILDGESGPDLWRFSLEGHGLEAGTLLSLADLDLTGEGSVDLYLAATGSPQAPRVEAGVVAQDGNVEDVPYDRLQATILWENGRTELRNLEASRRHGYVIRGRGEISPSQDENAPSSVKLFFQLTDGNLAILRDLWPDCTKAKGSFEGTLTVAPGPEGPVSTGFFSLTDASLSANKYVRGIKDLTVKLRLDRNRVFLEDVSGRVGRGRFVMTGDVGIEGFQANDYNLSFRTLGRRGIPVEVPQLSVPPGAFLNRFSLLRRTLEAVSQGEPRAELTVKGPQGSHVISGELILDNTHFTYPPGKDAFKGVSRTSWWSEFWRDAVWDVRVKTGQDTWYRNEYVNVHVDGNVSIQGPRDAIRVDGKVSADQGVVNYLSQPFDVRKALFEVGTDTRPGVSDGSVLAYLSGEAERNATTIDNRGVASLDVITMVIPRAPLGEIQPRFVSRNNPGLSSERVFQKMLGFSAQDPLQSPSPEEQDQLLRAGLVQLVGSSAGPFANRLAHLFGIDMISAIYDPTTTSAADNARPQDIGVAPRPTDPNFRPALSRWSDLLRGTGASAGVRLTDRLFGVYKFKVDQTVQNQVYLRDEVQVVGRVLGSLYVTFSTELDGRSLLGQPPNRQAMLEQQWRFGLPRRKTPKTDKTDTP